MLRAAQVLLAIIAVLGCSNRPGGSDASWVTEPTRSEHTSRYFPISSGPHDVECNSCHGSSSSFRGFDCLECHPQIPTGARHAGVPGYGYASPSCYACHPDGSRAGKMDHAAYFPITADQVHALGAPAVHVQGVIGCASCHPSADRAQTDCTTCHAEPAMAPLHVAVADLRFTTPNATSALCVKCHADARTPIAVARHAPFDVAGGAIHYQKACLGCHGVAKADKPFAQDFGQQSCTGCHDEATDQIVSRHGLLRITAVASDTASCLGCHPNGEAATNFEHIFFPIARADVHALGAPAVNAPGAIGCKSCHTTGESNKVDCTVCHDAADLGLRHTGLIGSEPGGGSALWSGTGLAPGGETANCLLCHASGGLQRIATHAQTQAQPAGFPIAGGNHFQSCERCHTARKSDPALRNPQLDFAASNCANCHSQARDSIETKHAAFAVDVTAATTSTCLSCHPDGGTVTSFNHPAFPIASTDVHALGAAAVHLSGTINCTSCHTAAAGYAKADCTTCHASTSMQPLHVAVSDLPATYASPDSASFATSALCLKCHADSQVPISVTTTPASHLPPVALHAPFKVADGAPHHQKPCLTCHAGARTDKPWAEDFTQKACSGCHSEAIDQIVSKHGGLQIAVLPAETARCLGCHPNGGATTSFDHPFFPIAAGQVHALGGPAVHLAGSIGCTSCHAAGDAAKVDCTGCHIQSAMAPAHASVADLQFTTPNETSALCVKCHAESQIPIRVADHAPFKVSAGALHDQKPCLTCHAVPRTDKPFAQDFTQQACFGCHSEAIDQVVSRHAVLQIAAVPTNTVSCLSCHPDGQPATNFNHLFFPIALMDVHALGTPAVHLPGAIACASCHTSGESTKVDCTGCHGPADQGARHSGLIGPGPGTPLWSGIGPAPGGETANCLLCHAAGGLQRIAAHAQSSAVPAGFPVASGNHFQSCEQCHTARKADPPLKNPQLDFAVADCANCHSQERDSVTTKHAAFGVEVTRATTATCLSCHANGGSVTSFIHPAFPIAQTDVHALGAPAVHVAGAIRCASCHTAGASGDYTKADCTTCHTSASMQPLHVAVPDLPATYASPDSATFATSALCLRCHAESQIPIAVATTPANHVPPVALHAPFTLGNGALHFRKPCLSCHAAARADKGWAQDFRQQTCIACHSEGIDQVVSRHALLEISAVPSDPLSCLSCHPDGQPATSFNHIFFPVAQADVHALGAPAVHVPGAIGCTSCHTAGGSASVDCTTCHSPSDQSARHSGLIGPEPGGGSPLWSGSGSAPGGETENCLLCHAAGDLQRVATHARTQAQPAGFPIASGNHFQSCEQCHTGRKTDAAWRYPQLDFAASNCANCHTEARDSVTTKHAAFGVDVASATTSTCLTCHANGGAVTSFNHPAFPIAQADIHALGAQAVHVPGTMGCASCHTQAISGDYTKADCTTCHASSSMQPLHVAVSDLPATYASPDSAAFATSALCLKCHADSQVPIAVATTPASHVPVVAQHAPFDVRGGAVHYRKPCLACHTAARADKPWAEDFARQACSGCHNETADQVVSRHGALQIAVLPAETVRCLGCHPNGGPVTSFNHPFFPIAQADVHALGTPAVNLPGTVSCTSCHTTGEAIKVDCTACHGAIDQNARHSGLIGPEPGDGVPLWSGTGAAPGGETANCLLCHPMAGLQRVATHARTPAQPAGFPITRGNHFQSCERCHTAQKTDPLLANPELDFAAANCANCHNQASDSTTSRHAAFGVDLTTPPATTATCLGCHSDGAMVASFNHPSFPIASANVHALGTQAVHVPGTIGCASCHTAAPTGDYTKADCTVCHASTSMQPLHVAVSDLPATYSSPDSATFATSALCLKCHGDSQVPVAVATTPANHVPPVAAHAPFGVGSGAMHYRKPCLSCHAVARNDKPWAEDFTQRACTGCHSETIDQVVSRHGAFQITVIAADTASCLSCHPNGEPATNFSHIFFPIGPSDVHALGAPAFPVAGNIGCKSCHTTGESTQVDCTVCHDPFYQSQWHDGPIGLGNNPPIWLGVGPTPDGETANCLLCHARAGLQRVATHARTPALPGGFPISSGNHFVSCELCHTARRTDPPLKNPVLDFAAVNCASCHNQSSESINTRHAAFGIDLTNPPATPATCLSCHAGGGTVTDFTHPLFPVAAADVHALGAPAIYVTGAISCANCHTPATNGDYRKVDCILCHSSDWMQLFHTAVSDLPATYGSADTATFATTALCLKCHADATIPVSIETTPPTHQPPVAPHGPFLIASGAGHYQKPCLGCHIASRTDKSWAADFAQPVGCTGCHTEPATSANHIGSYPDYPDTYSYSDAACLACHPAGSMGPFDHGADFPIAAADAHHSAVAPCTSCHSNPSNLADLTTISCIGCHSNNTAPPLPVDSGGVNSKHAPPATAVKIAGYAFDASTPTAVAATNRLCLKCHAGTVATPFWVNPLTLPLAWHTSLCFDVTSSRHSVANSIGGVPYCFKCHDRMNASVKPWGTDWTRVNCAACHANESAPVCQ